MLASRVTCLMSGYVSAVPFEGTDGYEYLEICPIVQRINDAHLALHAPEPGCSSLKLLKWSRVLLLLIVSGAAAMVVH